MRFVNCTFRGVETAEVLSGARNISFHQVTIEPATNAHSLNSVAPAPGNSPPVGKHKRWVTAHARIAESLVTTHRSYAKTRLVRRAVDPTKCGVPQITQRPDVFTHAMKRIAALPANQRVDALLKFFADRLIAMDSGTIRNLRDQVMARFASCGCSFDTCQLMIEFINGHLALRESGSHRKV